MARSICKCHDQMAKLLKGRTEWSELSRLFVSLTSHRAHSQHLVSETHSTAGWRHWQNQLLIFEIQKKTSRVFMISVCFTCIGQVNTSMWIWVGQLVKAMFKGRCKFRIGNEINIELHFDFWVQAKKKWFYCYCIIHQYVSNIADDKWGRVILWTALITKIIRKFPLYTGASSIITGASAAV